MIRRSGIREQIDGYRYDSFYVAPPGTFGRPDLDQGQRKPNEGWLERAREALSLDPITGSRCWLREFQDCLNGEGFRRRQRSPQGLAQD
jgi:hypothetical protein